MWARAFLFDLNLGDLTAYVHTVENVILFARETKMIAVAINRRDLYVICGDEVEPPCALGDLYVDFAQRFPDPIYAGFTGPICLDDEGYFESAVETPWDSHPLFCAKKIAAQMRCAAAAALPQPIAEELCEHIVGW